MNITPFKFEGTFIINGYKSNDERGWFWKNYQLTYFKKFGLHFSCEENFFSKSSPGVIRGMHFQVPPSEQAKLVTCIHGQVFDVLMDIRKSSSTFGCVASVVLSGEDNLSILVPPGVAHGFCVISQEDALMSYQTNSRHEPNLDQGIRWDSLPIKWPKTSSRIISKRDQEFKSWPEFQSPF